MSRIATSFLSCLLVSNFAFASEEAAPATANQPRLAVVAAAFEAAPLQLEAEGPGALFTSIDAAAIDALAYAYLQARGACDPEFMRGGTIHPVGEGYYSYGEIHRANRWESPPDQLHPQATGRRALPPLPGEQRHRDQPHQ